MFRIRENSDILFGYLQYKFCSKISFFRQGLHLLDVQGPRGGVDGGGKELAAAGGRRGADQGQGGEAADSDSRTEVRWS